MEQYIDTIILKIKDFIQEIEIKDVDDVNHNLHLSFGDKNEDLQFQFQFKKQKQYYETPSLQIKCPRDYLYHVQQIILNLNLINEEDINIKNDHINININQENTILECLYQQTINIINENSRINLICKFKDSIKQFMSKRNIPFYTIALEGFDIQLDCQGNKKFIYLLHRFIYEFMELDINYLKDTEYSDFKMKFRKIENVTEFLKASGISKLFKKLQPLDHYLNNYQIFETSLLSLLKNLFFLDHISLSIQYKQFQIKIDLESAQDLNQKLPQIYQQEKKQKKKDDVFITQEQDNQKNSDQKKVQNSEQKNENNIIETKNTKNYKKPQKKKKKQIEGDSFSDSLIDDNL